MSPRPFYQHGFIVTTADMACGDHKGTYSLYMISKCKLLVTRSKNEIHVVTRLEFFKSHWQLYQLQFQALQQKSQVKVNFIFGQNLAVSSPACIPIITKSTQTSFSDKLEMFHRAVQLSTRHCYLMITGWTLVYLRRFLSNTVTLFTMCFIGFVIKYRSLLTFTSTFVTFCHLTIILH